MHYLVWCKRGERERASLCMYILRHEYLRCWYNAVLCGGQNSRQRLAPRRCAAIISSSISAQTHPCSQHGNAPAVHSNSLFSLCSSASGERRFLRSTPLLIKRECERVFHLAPHLSKPRWHFSLRIHLRSE